MRNLNKKISDFLSASNGMSTMDIALWTAAAAIALTVFVVPILDSGSPASKPQFAQNEGNLIDPVLTGSVNSAAPQAPRKVVSISRSILQQPGEPPCLTYDDGSTSGTC